MNYNKEYYLNNREAIIEKQKLYYQNNKIKYLEYMKKYNATYYVKNSHNWNVRRNNKSLEEKQKDRKKYNNKNKNIILKEQPYKEPNFLISFN